MAETAVERRGVSIALACRAFGVSETCYRYSPKLKAENEVIADLLTGLTDARKTWGFGLCFLHLNRESHALGRWLTGLEARTHRNKAVVALANKLTRIVWAILKKPGTVYLRSKGAAA